MEINLNKKKVLRNLGASMKTGLLLLMYFLTFSILAQLYNDKISVGNDLIDIMQQLLPYAIYLSIFYILISIVVVAVGEFSNRNY